MRALVLVLLLGACTIEIHARDITVTVDKVTTVTTEGTTLEFDAGLF